MKKKLAVRFTSAVRAEWDRIGVDIRVRFRDALLDRYVGAAQRAMKAEDHERVWSKGRSMSFEATVAMALEQKPANTDPVAADAQAQISNV